MTGQRFKFFSLAGASALLAIVFVYLGWFFFSQQENRLRRSIRKIPCEERLAIEAFFHILILQEGGGYVLFGDKPMAFTAYFNNCNNPYENIGASRMWRYHLENKQIKEGWRAWEKYRHLFPSDRFVLECKPLDDTRSEICLMDKVLCEKMIADNMSDFRSVLGKDVNFKMLLMEYLNGERALFQLLQEHDALLGILLGFGTKNSWLFHERMMTLGRDPDAIHNGLLAIPPSSPQFSNEHNFTSVFSEKNQKKCYKFIHLPYFLGDSSSEETRLLREKYFAQRKVIQDRYAHGNFLEVTLKHLCSSEKRRDNVND